MLPTRSKLEVPFSELSKTPELSLLPFTKAEVELSEYSIGQKTTSSEPRFVNLTVVYSALVKANVLWSVIKAGSYLPLFWVKSTLIDPSSMAVDV